MTGSTFEQYQRAQRRDFRRVVELHFSRRTDELEAVDITLGLADDTGRVLVLCFTGAVGLRLSWDGREMGPVDVLDRRDDQLQDIAFEVSDSEGGLHCWCAGFAWDVEEASEKKA